MGSTLASSSTIREKAKVSLNGITAKSMRATGMKEKSTALEFGRVLMEITTKGNGPKADNKATESTNIK